MFISKGKVKGKHFFIQILAVNQYLKRKYCNFEIEGANMAEIPKQNKINKKYKIAMIFALFLLTIPTPYQKIFSLFPQYFENL